MSPFFKSNRIQQHKMLMERAKVLMPRCTEHDKSNKVPLEFRKPFEQAYQHVAVLSDAREDSLGDPHDLQESVAAVEWLTMYFADLIPDGYRAALRVRCFAEVFGEIDRFLGKAQEASDAVWQVELKYQAQRGADLAKQALAWFPTQKDLDASIVAGRTTPGPIGQSLSAPSRSSFEALANGLAALASKKRA